MLDAHVLLPLPAVLVQRLEQRRVCTRTSAKPYTLKSNTNLGHSSLKKLTHVQAWRLTRLAKRHFRRRIKRKDRHFQADRHTQARTAIIYRRGKYAEATGLALNGARMPSLFCLQRNPAETLSFVQALGASIDKKLRQFEGRHPTKKRKPISWCDFSTIDEISTSAALVLAAEFDRSRLIFKTKLFAIEVDSWKPEVVAALRQIGLFELLDIDVDPSAGGLWQGDDRSSIILKMQSGDEHDGRKLADLKDRLVDIAVHALGLPNQNEEDAIVAWSNRFLAVYTILSEAMDNVVEHAYRAVQPGRLNSVHRWWMTAAVSPTERRLVIAIYDRGSTIPATLPAWRNFNRVSRVWNRMFGFPYDPEDATSDGMALRTALKIAVSSTNDEFRGKGLSMMADFLNSCRGGRLRIVSRCGTLVKEKGAKAVVETHSQRLPGTLVEWDVSL